MNWSAISTEMLDDTSQAVNAALATYLKTTSPEQIAKEAISRMAEKGYEHNDLKWEHVALHPRIDKVTSFTPILIDLADVNQLPKGPLPLDFVDNQFKRMMERHNWEAGRMDESLTSSAVAKS